MACTSQSALNYVKSARRHLVRELQNLSVILENLNQKRFLSDEDVRNIQAEGDDYDRTRKILDSVMIKGEAACYELLRIIDVTRNRTLERPAPVPEKNTGASTGTQKFDLHHWISCFSFNEDTQMDVDYLQGPRPCHRYQKKLKFKAQKLSQEFWNASKNLFEENRRPDLSYTSLVLDTQKSTSLSKIKKVKKKKGKMSRHKKLRTYIPEDKPKISPTDLLKTQENILLVGKPGIGKTAVVCEMLRLWAEKDNKELDYMFYFDMREMSQTTQTMSLKDLLFNAFSEPDGGVDEVLQDIKSNSDNVTIIFDGVTDLSPSVVRKLVEKELLPDAKIIITCRPDDEEDFFSENCLRVEVKGFSEQTIKSYLSAMLSDTQKVLSSLELLTLCHVPMYALMVAACSSSEDSPQPCTITEIYIDIVRYCLQINSNKTNSKDLNSINTKREEILSLAEKAFHATQGKTVNLTEVPCKDSCVLSFLKTLFINEKETRHAFLHYTLQEFFAAVWLLKNPDKIRNVFQQSLTEEMKHMKHLIPFMCRLLNKKSPSWMKCLIPAEELNSTSKWFFKELITTFIPDVDILFLCQCLYESQSPEACIYLLDKLDYRLELCGESLDPYPCCAVAYVVNQSKERKIRLNLDDDVTISEKGMRQLFGCLQNVQWCDLLPQQLWKIFLLSEEQMDFVSLLGLDDNQLHLPVEGKKQLFERAVEVMKRMTTKVNVCLYWDRETPVCQSRCESLIEALPYISSLRVQWWKFGLDETTRFFVNLFCAAAEREQQTGEKILELLSSVCRYETFPLNHHWCDFLLDLYSYVAKTGLRVLPSLQSVFQSAPAVWSINLSERKTSILLEVLKLQSGKKQVKLTDWSHEESEVRSFLQCLPYISQLRVQRLNLDKTTRFFRNLFCAAAEREQQTGEKILELLSSVCRYKTFPLNNINNKYQSDFLLDLFSHVKDCETKTGLRVLPSLQSVFQSAPAVWSINLSERKTSILLEVLKLQSEKKPVELTGWSHEESEVRSFLQCLPYISQLSVQRLGLDKTTRIFVNLFCAAAEREQQTGEKILELLPSLCSYKTFTLKQKWCDFLLDLYSYVAETGLRVLPSLQSVFQSAPAVWSINLSERKTSILLEVLKLQSEKKPVELTGWSHEESEVRSFLQCLPYISQLKLSEDHVQQLLVLVHEVQDQDLTLSLLNALSGDLTSCSLNWELLHYLLQQCPAQTITVNLRKNRFLQESTARLLPFLGRIVIKRPSPSLVMTSIRELYRAHASHMVPSLLRSLDHVINLSCRELDSVDFAALLFTLRHSDRVKLNLRWASIPAEGTQSILSTLDRVSQLSVDRNQLLRFIHCCAASDAQQEAASGLLRTLQHRLDLSCQSCVDLQEEDQTEPLSLTADDCRAASMVLKHCSRDTQLHLQDCEVEDGGLDLLFSVLDRVRLRVSKSVLLQLLSLLPVHSERDTVRRAESLCGALGGELDLSHSTLDQRVCGGLVQMLDSCEGLTELDLSHCQLSDQLLLPLITHLHKVQVLDLRYNQITDASTDVLLQLISIHSSIHTVRLFSNDIVDRRPFEKHKQFEMW
ncbi:protein NLRC5-like isoform X2 [Acanthochromis polyacanthus]|uniref:protein NLRC5-like isoform X2 n=1 Tax=Acanthochromis polyacanthus TaxID=80966 RepID=UPI002233FCF1|nr:protein NLRC5-like isoform X2 [Acanthochromis polyacanthus]